MSVDNLELIYWGEEGGMELPLADWQYSVIQQILGLDITTDGDKVYVSSFTKEAVSKRLKKINIRPLFYSELCH